MAEIYCFILFENAEPFMMSIDKEVNYQNFDEEIKRRLSNTEEVLLYSYNNSRGENLIQNDKDLAEALSYAESFGEDYLFVINISAKPKNNEEAEEEEEEVEEEREEEEVEEEREEEQENDDLEELLEEFENLVPEKPKDTSSFSVPISVQKDVNVKEKVEEKKESDKKDEGAKFFEFLKNRLAEQYPHLSPIIESINYENILNNVNTNNENKDEELPKEVKFIHQFLKHLPKESPIPSCPPPPPSPFPFAQTFPHPHPPPYLPPFNQTSPSSIPIYFPFPPSPSADPKPKATRAPKVSADPSSIFSAFVPPFVQPQNPLQYPSFADFVNTSLNRSEKQPKQHQVPHSATCDHCTKQIVGIRYKCLSCPDFDLCEKCEVNSQRTHNPDHVFAKIRNASQRMFPFTPSHPQCRAMPHQRIPQPPSPFVKPHVHARFCPTNIPHRHTSTEPTVKPSFIRNVEVKSSFVPPFVPPFAIRPHSPPENDKIKKLEEKIASLESSMANIQSSIAKQKVEKPKPKAVFRKCYLPIDSSDSDSDSYSDSSDSDPDSDDGNDSDVIAIEFRRY